MDLSKLIAKWRKAAAVDREENRKLNARLQAGETVMINTTTGPYTDQREVCADELEAALAAESSLPQASREVAPTCDYISVFYESMKCGRVKGHDGLHMLEPLAHSEPTQRGVASEALTAQEVYERFFAPAREFIQKNGYADWDGSANGQTITLTGCANMLGQYMLDRLAGREEPAMPEWTPERLARRFHQEYELLAPQYDYKTRKESAMPWLELAENHRKLMIAVCGQLLYEMKPFHAASVEQAATASTASGEKVKS